MKSRPTIGILVSNKVARKGILEIYQGYHWLDIRLFAFTGSGVNWKKRSIRGLGYKDGQLTEAEYPFPDAVYSRLYNKRKNIILRLEKQIGSRCFNVVSFLNKWEVYNILNNTPLGNHLPETFIYNEVRATELLEKHRLLYLKACYGNKGSQVYRIELFNNGEVEIAAQSLTSKKSHTSIQTRLDEIVGSKRFILQKGIRLSQINKQPYDIRVLVQKGISGLWQASTIACRLSFKYFSNTSSFKSIYDAEALFAKHFPGDAKYSALLQSAGELSIYVADVLESEMGLLGEIGVDFGVDQEGKLWIIEVNGKPQKSMFLRIADFKEEKLVYSRPLEFAYYLAKAYGRGIRMLH